MREPLQVFQPFVFKGFILFALLGAGFVHRTTPNVFQPKVTLAGKTEIKAKETPIPYSSATVLRVGQFSQR